MHKSKISEEKKRYNIEIIKMAEAIINKQDYRILWQVLISYDDLVKKEKGIKDDSLPFWVLNTIKKENKDD